MSAPVLALIVALTLLSMTVLAVEPLRRARAIDIASALQRRAAASTTSKAERRAQRLMVAIQVATCVVLVATIGVIQSAHRALGRIEMGYDDHEIVQAMPDYGLLQMDVPAQWDLARSVAERLGDHPAIASVAVWEKVGEDYPPRPELDAVFDGPPRDLGLRERLGWYYAVEPGFFEAMGIELLSGRALTRNDGPGDPLVAVVTENGADAWWPGEDPIGRQVRLGERGAWMTVVGVIEEVRAFDELGRSAALSLSGGRMPFLFAPHAQWPLPPPGWRPYGCCAGVMIGVKPASSTEVASAALRAELATAAPQLPVTIGTMAELQVSGGYPGSRIAAAGRLLGAGTAVGVLLAMLGIVGVVRETLQRRTREIGLRVALGAHSRSIVGFVARDSVLTVVAGIGLGVAVLYPLDLVLSDTVFDYSIQRLSRGVLDPTVLGAAALVIAIVSFATAALAARRAASLDPAVALRSE
jgi:hypothetical protein